MPVAGPAMAEAVAQMLSAIDIRLHPKRQVQHIEPASRELVFADVRASHLRLPGRRTTPPYASRDARTAMSNDAGLVLVDRRTLKSRFDNVYAVGDATMITLANGKPLPKAGTFAHAQAEVVARTHRRRVPWRRASTVEFDGAGDCWLETGGGSAGFTSGQFYAEPDPLVPLPRAGRPWHWGKVMFETWEVSGI